VCKSGCEVVCLASIILNSACFTHIRNNWCGRHTKHHAHEVNTSRMITTQVCATPVYLSRVYRNCVSVFATARVFLLAPPNFAFKYSVDGSTPLHSFPTPQDNSLVDQKDENLNVVGCGDGRNRDCCNRIASRTANALVKARRRRSNRAERRWNWTMSCKSPLPRCHI
jgi:hypothetical protein